MLHAANSHTCLAVSSIYAGYLIRPMVGQHTPAVTLCYQAGVLDPGMRVFKRPPTARFGYVQEVPYEPEVAITVKDYKEVIQPAGQCYLQQPISQWRKCKDKEAAESREDTGGLDQGVYLDCSRVSLPSDSSSGEHLQNAMHGMVLPDCTGAKVDGCLQAAFLFEPAIDTMQCHRHLTAVMHPV